MIIALIIINIVLLFILYALMSHIHSHLQYIEDLITDKELEKFGANND